MSARLVEAIVRRIASAEGAEIDGDRDALGRIMAYEDVLRLIADECPDVETAEALDRFFAESA